MNMRMKWQLAYPGHKTGNARGERKEQTPTPTHLAQSGQTLKGKGKERRTDDGPNPDQSA